MQDHTFRSWTATRAHARTVCSCEAAADGSAGPAGRAPTHVDRRPSARCKRAGLPVSSPPCCVATQHQPLAVSFVVWPAGEGRASCDATSVARQALRARRGSPAWRLPRGGTPRGDAAPRGCRGKRAAATPRVAAWGIFRVRDAALPLCVGGGVPPRGTHEGGGHRGGGRESAASCPVPRGGALGVAGGTRTTAGPPCAAGRPTGAPGYLAGCRRCRVSFCFFALWSCHPRPAPRSHRRPRQPPRRRSLRFPVPWAAPSSAPATPILPL